MKNVRILDCTLRDGGRIIDCKFEDDEIRNISDSLSQAKIDIVEVGFLRDWHDVDYLGNSTFFTDVDQMKPFINKNSTSLFVAFVDYGMFDINSLKSFDGTSIDGIRLGFTKKDYLNYKHDIIQWANIIKEKGYKLFIQGVNSLNYSDFELLEVINMINDLKPFSFGIVDTYGAMYIEDVDRLYRLIDHNMSPEICINFHSHNNYQLSFAFAQEVIKLSSRSQREIIIDGTLSGMGKVAGNLNTELVVDFLVRKFHYNYDLDTIFDCIDDYIYKYSINYRWGYSVSSLMAGIYKSHPNNIIYLNEKFRLNSKDIGKILSMITPELRQTYDYDSIEKIYKEYAGKSIDDKKYLTKLKKHFENRDILVLVPGSSLNTFADKIDQFINEYNPVVISINFDSEYEFSWSFYGNKKRYNKSNPEQRNRRTIITSNIESKNSNDYLINYHSVISREHRMFDNSTIMLMNIMKKMDINTISFAGFDGFSKEVEENFKDSSFQNARHNTEHFDEINKDISLMLCNFADSISDRCKIRFLTPTYYKEYIKRNDIEFIC